MTSVWKEKKNLINKLSSDLHGYSIVEIMKNTPRDNFTISKISKTSVVSTEENFDENLALVNGVVKIIQ